MENVKLDTREADKILAQLSDKRTVHEILYEGLEAMSDVYYNEILASLRREMGSSADAVGINGKWKYPLSSGIKKHPNFSKVQIGLHGLTDFRLVFFEGGTQPRTTKGHKIVGYDETSSRKRLKRTGKAGYRGFITANHFFTKGVSNAENPALNALVDAVNKALQQRNIK